MCRDVLVTGVLSSDVFEDEFPNAEGITVLEKINLQHNFSELPLLSTVLFRGLRLRIQLNQPRSTSKAAEVPSSYQKYPTRWSGPVGWKSETWRSTSYGTHST